MRLELEKISSNFVIKNQTNHSSDNMKINDYGFLRVAAASPKMKVADCDYNVSEIKTVIAKAVENDVQIVCFPELCITGSTCGDLFFQTLLQQKAMQSLTELTDFMVDKPSLIAIVGLPLVVKNTLFNVAAVLSKEGILGIIPKTFIPENEKRWFASSADICVFAEEIGGKKVPIAAEEMLLKTPFGSFGIEIGEDLWSPIPPSSRLAMQGADVIFNLSASNELVGKNRYRKSLIAQQSAGCTTAYVYAGAGCGESSTDLVFSGACFIAENGVMLAESKRFSLDNELIITDIDISALRNERLKNTNFTATNINENIVPIHEIEPSEMVRKFNPHPFIPSKENEAEVLPDVLNIQTHGLAKRLMHTKIERAVIGVSGGLDSTLALLVTVKTFDLLGLPRENIHGITMPGFGTTNRTYTNATELMKLLNITTKEISIVDAVTQHLKNIGHDINDHNITYENAQARERTQILMDYANKINGLVVGTGNLSELALGWTTYNGDHMSMYAVNAGVPKTLVASLVGWIADEMCEPTRKILHDILDTPFSPELLPADKEGKITQKTEHFVGPYELHDFFLYRMLRYGDTPKRIYFIAKQAFAEKYSSDEIRKWLKIFYQRFFAQQFKRSCMPDSPKVGSISLSPRGDWCMPSDAVGWGFEIGI
jgi:NAD+ synthase (glutamine-hydrolysing)